MQLFLALVVLQEGMGKGDGWWPSAVDVCEPLAPHRSAVEAELEAWCMQSLQPPWGHISKSCRHIMPNVDVSITEHFNFANYVGT